MLTEPTHLSMPNYISISSAVFAQLMAVSVYTLQCVLTHD